jgi:hypothetical protein
MIGSSPFSTIGVRDGTPYTEQVPGNAASVRPDSPIESPHTRALATLFRKHSEGSALDSPAEARAEEEIADWIRHSRTTSRATAGLSIAVS